MPHQCYGCGSNFTKDSALRGHLNNSRQNCRAMHDRIVRNRTLAAEQSLVDPNDLEQWQLQGLHDPEPRDDSYPQEFDGGRFSPDSDLLPPDRATKRNRSGTIDRSSLVQAEHRPFPNAAKVIRRGQPIPWEVHVSLNILYNNKPVEYMELVAD